MNKVSQFLVGMSVMAALAACSSNPHKVEKLEDQKITEKGTLYDSKIGINDKDEAVIRKETLAETEVKNMEWQNYDKEQKLNSEYHILKRCRQDLADPRLGGSKKVVDLPEIEQTLDDTKEKEAVGLDEDGNLKVVKNQYLDDKIKSEKYRGKILADVLRTVSKLRDSCEFDLKNARVEHGLPGERVRPIIKFDADGKTTVIRKGEQTLDDVYDNAQTPDAHAKTKTPPSNEQPE